MSTAKKLDKNKLTSVLPQKKEVIKKKEDDIVQQIHEPPPHSNGTAVPAVKEPITRVTLDVPDSVYRAMKKHIVDTEETQRDYILRLLKVDLNLLS